MGNGSEKSRLTALSPRKLTETSISAVMASREAFDGLLTA
jgi:hypothetical protein